MEKGVDCGCELQNLHQKSWGNWVVRWLECCCEQKSWMKSAIVKDRYPQKRSSASVRDGGVDRGFSDLSWVWVKKSVGE